MTLPDWVRDPVDHTPLTLLPQRLVDAHGRTWPIWQGIPQLLAEVPPPPGLAQRAMTFEPMVRIYEGSWRPWFTRLGTHIDAQAEDAFVAAYTPTHAQRAVDLGCGTGRITRWLHTTQGVPEVVGVDLSQPMLVHARTTSPLPWLRASACHLPIADHAVDVVTSFGAFHLFPDPGRALREMARVLRPGGVLLLHTAIAASSGTARRMQPLIHQHLGIRFLSRPDLTSLVEQAGLSIRVTQTDGAVGMFRCILNPT